MSGLFCFVELEVGERCLLKVEQFSLFKDWIPKLVTGDLGLNSWFPIEVILKGKMGTGKISLLTSSSGCWSLISFPTVFPSSSYLFLECYRGPSTCPSFSRHAFAIFPTAVLVTAAWKPKLLSTWNLRTHINHRIIK